MFKHNNPMDWERAVVLELTREHDFVCRIHKVSLRPIAIMLFDSEALWGQFDNRTRTISISRKLVKGHSWHQVLGVFRHEMAHQLVAERSPQQFLSDRPHSEVFKEACRCLGVPDQFAKAGINLQCSSLDWRSERRDTATEKILEKTKKLLALAGSANEHEAHLAMERVRELYAKYNLEHLATLAKESFVHLVITHNKKRMESWEQRTVSILTEHFFVKILTFQQFDANTGNRVHALEFIGTRENVLMAEYVYYFLLRQVDFLLKQALASELGLIRSERSSFRLGVLDGFSKKLKHSERAAVSASSPASSTTNSTALTVIGEALAKFRSDAHFENYVSGIYPRIGQRRQSSIAIDGEAFAAGHAAGRSITLNKPISSQMGNQGRLLS